MKTDEVFFLPEADAVGTADARLSWFTSATSTAPKAVGSLQGFIAECRGENYKAAVTAIRQAAAVGDKNRVGLLKRGLPAATMSCAMTSRAKDAPERVRTHSGWLQCDFDGKENLGLVQDAIRARLQADPHVGAVFVGPSGVGIKCAVRIDGGQHLASFATAKDYFREEYSLSIDKACKDVERLCFVSYDPDAWCRDGETQVLQVTAMAEKEIIRPVKQAREITPFEEDQHDMSIEDVREILKWLPKRPDYDTWLRIVSGVFSVLPLAAGVMVLNEWAPEEHPGEYERKHRNRLKNVTIRTVIHYAQQYGFDAGAASRRKTWLGRIIFGKDNGAAAKACTAGLDPSSDPPQPSAASADGDYMTFDDVQQDAGDKPPKIFVIDDSLPDDVGSQYDGEPEPPNMNYYTSPRSLMRYPLIKGKPGVRLPTVNNPVSAFAWQLADLLHEKPVFSRSGFCVKLDDDKRGMVLFRDQVFRTFIEETTAPHVVSVKKNNDGTSEISLLPHTCSGDVSKAVLASRRFLAGLRKLKRVLPCKLPVMRGNGRIELPGAGYDAETSTWITSDPEAAYDSAPMPLAEAVAFFEDLLSEFPFAEDGGRSKAVAVSAILSVYCTALLPSDATKPAFLYVANSEGSGKTTLAKLAALTAQSGDAPVEAAPADEAEWGKKMLSLVISGRRVVLLDNLKGNLASATLEAYLTSPLFTGRVLGGNTEFTGEAGATVLITGNGVTTSPDLRRRTLMCELFSPLLRPEDRVYQRSLDPVRIKELRPQILAACWGLVAAWDAAGRPGSSMTSASFQRWADTVGGIIEHAGWACPLAAPKVTTAGDTDASDVATLPDVLDVNDMRSFASLAELCENAGLFEAVTSDKDFGQNLTPAARASFGLILRRFDGRVVGVDEKGGAVRFVIEGSGRNRVYGLRQA